MEGSGSSCSDGIPLCYQYMFEDMSIYNIGSYISGKVLF